MRSTAARVASSRCAMPSRVARSAATNQAAPPAARIVSGPQPVRDACWRPVSTTWAPSRAKAEAMAAPMPDEAPVTNAVFPAKRMRGSTCRPARDTCCSGYALPSCARRRGKCLGTLHYSTPQNGSVFDTFCVRSSSVDPASAPLCGSVSTVQPAGRVQSTTASAQRPGRVSSISPTFVGRQPAARRQRPALLAASQALRLCRKLVRNLIRLRGHDEVVAMQTLDRVRVPGNR